MEESPKSMSGKVCVITGATSGIGAATALCLAGQGATIVGVGRNAAKSSAILDQLTVVSGECRHEFFLADLSVQADVRRLAGQLKDKYRRLDVLINNAGARFSSRLLSAEGLEMSFALNHLGPFLLTNLLLEELQTSGRGRIINVSSGAHRRCHGIPFEDLQGERSFSGREAYARSKLANLLFTYELDRRTRGSGVTVNAADPGNVISGFSRNNGFFSWARHIMASLKSGGLVGPMEGARTSVYLASSPEVEGVSGKYFRGEEAVASSEPSYDTDAASRLWEISIQLVVLGVHCDKERPV